MGKDLKGREIGPGFCQRMDGKYVARYVNPYGQRKCPRCRKGKEEFRPV